MLCALNFVCFGQFEIKNVQVSAVVDTNFLVPSLRERVLVDNNSGHDKDLF
jgi:hypothetical protein